MADQQLTTINPVFEVELATLLEGEAPPVTELDDGNWSSVIGKWSFEPASLQANHGEDLDRNETLVTVDIETEGSRMTLRMSQETAAHLANVLRELSNG